MKKTKQTVISAVVIASMLSSNLLITTTVNASSATPQNTVTVSDSVTPQNTVTAHRIAGATRYATADAISEKFISADTVIIANGDNFPDALCAAPLAKQYKAPILLSSSTGLSTTTLAEITRLKATKAIIIGGTGTVTSNVETQLTSAGVTATRIAGTDRYETSLLVAKQLTNPTAVVVAYGQDFPDALSISSIAAQLNMPIILSDTDGLSADAEAYIKNSGATKTYIVGGTGVLAEKTDGEVVSPVRLSGANRYDTDLAVLNQFSSVLNFDSVFLATGNNFADALSGAAAASQTASPVVLVSSDIDTKINEFLAGHVNLNTKAVALGGTSTVTDSIVGKIMDDKALVSVAKTYSTAGTVTGDKITGSAIISASGVNLKDTTISGDLLIASTIGDGNIDLDNVTITGKVIVNGGGSHSIHFHNMTVANISLDKTSGEQARLVTDATSSITSATVESNGNVDESVTSKAGTVVINQGASVTLVGNFDAVQVAGSGSKVDIKNSKITTLDITAAASNVSISTSASTTITTLNVNALANVTGAAVITTANIGVNGVSIESRPTTVAFIKGISATIGGDTRSSTDGTSIVISSVPTASSPANGTSTSNGSSSSGTSSSGTSTSNGSSSNGTSSSGTNTSGGSSSGGTTITATAITDTAIAGITAPVIGGIPVSTIPDATQYTATIAWTPTSTTTFAAITAYTATITITPKTGYTLTGVAANCFTVAGATATNAINSGVVTAVFPATGAVTSTSYLEDYREQYHYSMAKGWANDPNGMVYFNGEYHLFYQYYPDDVIWGPMHWGQAVSTDLIHWKEIGVALAPDTGGTIFSGSAVVDKDNTSGFFDGIQGGGLVAIYTQDYTDANGQDAQKESIAYSKDNGVTWTKYEGNPVIASSADPLKNPAFRDPKVFWSEDANEWMMVVAGGPLRFFSSTDLKTWKAEGNHPEITTECPDFYKLEVGDTGTYKWVLSEGGRSYMTGDFKQVSGVWNFVPDSATSLPMNFSKDAYAAQTYYGTPDGRRIMINWMNNWDYANSIGQITKTFNGSFTLQNEMKLINTANGIRLTQQPIQEYETLRQAGTNFNNVTISPDQPNIMSNLSGSQYEIVAEFAPDAATTEFGFNLRVGKDADQETVVKYDVATGQVTIDRTKSGRTPSNSAAFLQSYSSQISRTADGKIQLHIFVDAASVEVYGNNGEVTGTAQIFPNRSSEGIEVYSVGGSTNATINYYPLSGIWNNAISGTNSALVSLSEGSITKNVGDTFTIFTTTVPTTATQGVDWSISDPSVVKIVSQDNEKTTFEVTGVGNTNLTATSKDGKSTATASLGVYDRTVTPDISNLTNFQSTSGNWFVNKDNGVNTYTADARGIGDGFVTADQKNDDLTATYTYTADAKFLSNGKALTDGVASLVLYSQTRDASQGSIVANILWNGQYRVFNYPAGQNVASGTVPVDPNGIYHLKAVIQGAHIKYWINNTLVCDADEPYYTTPGYFGLNACNSEIEYTNIELTKVASDTSTLVLSQKSFEQGIGDTFTVSANQKVDWNVDSNSIVQITSQDDSQTVFKVVTAGAITLTATDDATKKLTANVTLNAYDTNPANVSGLVYGLTNLHSTVGSWYDKNSTYAANSGGDAFAMSDTSIDLSKNPKTEYTYEANANISSGNVATLILLSQDEGKPNASSIAANFSISDGSWRIFQFPNGNNIASGNVADKNIPKSATGDYKLKVVLLGSNLLYYINDVLVCNTTQPLTSGYLGLNVWNANVAFTNIKLSSTDISGTDSVAVALSEGSLTKKVGDTFTILTPTIPSSATQGVTWSISDSDIVSITTQSAIETDFVVNKIGSTALTATSADAKSTAATILNVCSNDPSTVTGLVTGLSNLKESIGSWYVNGGAYVGKDDNDTFAMSTTAVDVTTNSSITYDYEATADMSKSFGGAATLILFSQDSLNPKLGSVACNIDTNGHWKLFEFVGADGSHIAGKEGDTTKSADGIYKLKVVLIGNSIEYFINDVSVYKTTHTFKSGYLGLNVWNGNVAFTNIKLSSSISDATAPTVAATVTTGSAIGMTSITATPDGTDTFATKVQGEAFTTPVVGSTPTGATAYILGADLAVTAGQHVGLYELDANGKVIKFIDLPITASDIQNS